MLGWTGAEIAEWVRTAAKKWQASVVPNRFGNVILKNSTKARIGDENSTKLQSPFLQRFFVTGPQSSLFSEVIVGIMP